MKLGMPELKYVKISIQEVDSNDMEVGKNVKDIVVSEVKVKHVYNIVLQAIKEECDVEETSEENVEVSNKVGKGRGVYERTKLHSKHIAKGLKKYFAKLRKSKAMKLAWKRRKMDKESEDMNFDRKKETLDDAL